MNVDSIHRNMPSSTATPVLIAAAVVWVVIAVAPSDARAEKVYLPRIGQQYFSAGLSLQPGFVYDGTVPGASEWSPVSATGAGVGRLGLHQLVSEQFVMSGEADVGLQWLNEHTAEPTGRADSELGFAWQIGILGRWLPAGYRAGWSVGGGPHLFTTYLSDRPLQSLGFDLRVGRYLWRSNEDFGLVEFGYAIPAIQGLSSNNTFETEQTERVPKDWTFHRFSISVQYGF